MDGFGWMVYVGWIALSGWFSVNGCKMNVAERMVLVEQFCGSEVLCEYISV
jgi:hypothetical protein